MQYLVHVSHDAENLQFWLWIQDYIKRFFAIPRSEQALSPPWNPDEFAQTSVKLHDDLPKASGKSELSMIEFLAGLDSLGDAKPSTVVTPFGTKSFMSDRTSSSRTVTDSVNEANAEAGLNWNACKLLVGHEIRYGTYTPRFTVTIQPFRSEIDRVINHYLAPNAPRELNLTYRDRAAVLHALQHTTHPSAFSVVGDMVEADLRGQSHPNFIRWSICNGNKPRVRAVRNSGIAHVAVGLIIAILLVLSGKSRWWRLFIVPLFLIGFSISMAAHQGLCMIIHSSHTRALRPWEQFGDSTSSAYPMNTLDAESSSSVDGHSMSTHRLEKGASFDPFGTSNTNADQSWMSRYDKVPLIRKILTPQIWIQDQTIRMLQDRIVLQCHFCSLVVTISLTTIFLVMPGYDIL